MQNKNEGFSPESIEALKQELLASGKPYKIIPSDDNSEEFVNFYFIGIYEGKEVIYDAALYTLRLHHSSEVYELAEHKAAQRFPNFKGIHYEEDENGNLKPLSGDEEEIGLYSTEIIMELEEEEDRLQAYKVSAFGLMIGVGIMFVPQESMAELPGVIASTLSNGLITGTIIAIILEQALIWRKNKK